MSTTIWPNISIVEATCPCCGQMADHRLLDKLQKLRDFCGFPLPFNSIIRCPSFNSKIGGSKYSLHKKSGEKNGYGAADIGIAKRWSRKRWKIIKAAMSLKANNIEVCDQHIHIGWAPKDDVMENRLYWGLSK